MFIPGELISMLTFPGVIVHELAHEFFCRRFGIIVYEVKYFRPWLNPAGYVLHGKTTSYKQEFWISVGPFIINTLLAVIICFPVSTLFFDLGAFNINPLYYVLLWLGVSIGMHAFPSSGDAKNLWANSKKACTEGNPWGYLGFPMAALIRVLNFGSMFWLDSIFAIAVIWLAPRLLVLLLK
jgi:hypothetical protein